MLGYNKIGIFSNKLNDDFFQIWGKIFKVLKGTTCKFWFAPEVYCALANHNKLQLPPKENIIETIGDLDCIISIGGDGTFLEAVSNALPFHIPVMGINTGRLGFLADISPSGIEKAMTGLLLGDFYIEQRSLIQTEFLNSKKEIFPFGLNEITIHKRDTSSMIRINTFIDNVLLTSYWADGLIIATPTGSTAYSMSAGGPIVSPESNTLIITPIASHNLTVRPLVIPNTHHIRLQIESRESKYLLSIDSKSWPIDELAEILVSKAKESAKIIKFNDYNFFKNIQRKLMWGIDKRK